MARSHPADVPSLFGWPPAAILAAFLAVAGRSFTGGDEVDYNRDVRPILSETCFACPGFDEAARQADLRRDVADSALADRDGVPALVPGKPEASEVWRRITSS